MAKQEYSFPTSPDEGRTHQVSSEEQAADSPSRPEIPQLEPNIRGIAEAAGADSNAMEGEALLRKSNGARDNTGILRDGDNAKSLGDQPDYPTTLTDQMFKGEDHRPGR